MSVSANSEHVKGSPHMLAGFSFRNIRRSVMFFYGSCGRRPYILLAMIEYVFFTVPFLFVYFPYIPGIVLSVIFGA